MRTLLIGEQPPEGAELATAAPLFPVPAGCAGARLAALAELAQRDYLEAFDRMNLLPYPGKWHKGEAAWAATALIRGGGLRDRRVILLGERVRAAFSIEWPIVMGIPLGEWQHCARLRCESEVTWLPHPSGRSRKWNDMGVRRIARELLRAEYRRWLLWTHGEVEHVS